jgi:predicted dehydrogenase
LLKELNHDTITHVADIDPTRAEQGAARYGISTWGSLDNLLADPNVDIVVNITPPTAHAEVTQAAVKAGKHVYTEKPVATSTSEASTMPGFVEASSKRLGSAPDTFLGSAGQTARAVIDRGEIGEVIGFTAFSTHNRVELWHPNPTFLCQPGGGPVFDLGPYFIAALVNLLGPVAQVAGKTRIGARTRQILAPNRLVDLVEVKVPTHANAVLTFASGAIGTLVMSNDIWDHRLPNIEIFGTLGTKAVPHPNWYNGEVSIKTHDDQEWRVVEPITVPLQGEISPGQSDAIQGQLLRGLGVMDLIDSLAGAPHRTSAALAYHTLEVLESIQRYVDGSDAAEHMRTACWSRWRAGMANRHLKELSKPRCINRHFNHSREAQVSVELWRNSGELRFARYPIATNP